MQIQIEIELNGLQEALHFLASSIAELRCVPKAEPNFKSVPVKKIPINSCRHPRSFKVFGIQKNLKLRLLNIVPGALGTAVNELKIRRAVNPCLQTN